MKRITRRLVKNPTLMLGATIVALLIFVAALAPVIAPHVPTDPFTGDRLQPPSRAHLLGTDEMGRDMLSRVIFGSRISLRVGFIVISLAGSVGITLGAIAGYWGGRTETVVMRLTDIFLAFPRLVLALAVVTSLGPGITNAMVAVTVTWWPWYCRLMRSLVLPLRKREFVEAAKAAGSSNIRIILRHILPNCAAPLIVQATMDMGYVVLTMAALGFIGLGAQPPTPEWGAMVAAGRRYLMDYWWYITFPGLAIFLTVLGFSLLGDGIRDVIDPLTD